MNNYHVLIVPSSDDEKQFESCSTFHQAWFKHESGGFSTALYSFATKGEQTAFIKGYESAIGFLGHGIYFTNYSSQGVSEKTQQKLFKQQQT